MLGMARRVTMRKRGLVVIEGVPGVGKRQVAQALAERLHGRLLLDEAEDNPFLADPKADALCTQLFFLSTRTRAQRLFLQEDLFSPWTFADFFLPRDLMYARRTLRDAELDLYLDLYPALSRGAGRPDLLVWLDAGPGDDPGLFEAYRELMADDHGCPMLRVDPASLTEEAGLRELVQAILRGETP